MNNTRTKQPIVFLGVGILNTLFDFFCYTLLSQTVFKESVSAAGFISGTIALIAAFITHSFITWHGANVGRKTLLKFVFFTGFGMWIIRPILLGIFILLTPLYISTHDVLSALHLPFSYDFIAKTGAFGFMIVILLIYNFLTYDRFVFKKIDT